jgi:hypothetical protein
VHFSSFPCMPHAPSILSSLLFKCWHLQTSCHCKILRLYRVLFEQVALPMDKEAPPPSFSCSKRRHLFRVASRAAGMPGV